MRRPYSLRAAPPAGLPTFRLCAHPRIYLGEHDETSPQSFSAFGRNGGRSSRLRTSRRKTSRRNEPLRRRYFFGSDAVKLPRRTFLHLAAGAAALPAVSRVATAQSYPSRPVRLVVGFAADSTTDILARLMGQWLSERLGQQFIIEN